MIYVTVTKCLLHVCSEYLYAYVMRFRQNAKGKEKKCQVVGVLWCLGEKPTVAG